MVFFSNHLRIYATTKSKISTRLVLNKFESCLFVFLFILTLLIIPQGMGGGSDREAGREKGEEQRCSGIIVGIYVCLVEDIY